ncbi:MAG: phosphomethylpyrimidine synthase ThiC [Candidatus Hydrothermales bacterium]
MTQLEYARSGKITDEMRYVAESEGKKPEEIRELIASGRVIIPRNINHKNLLKFSGVGEGLKVKINTNIGTSYDYVNLEEEIEKARIAIEYGTDTLMDLSTGGDIKQIRKKILEICTVPFGTVPIYEVEFTVAREKGSIFEMKGDDIFKVIEEHGKDGVDFITVHSGINIETLKIYQNSGRLTGIVSRGGGLIAAWMIENKEENPLYKYFDRLLEIAREYDITLSLGDGLRPGSINDSTDRAQIAELLIIGELVEKARRAGVQVMVEGPGHVPLNEIKTNIQIQKKLTKNAPFYILGMLPTDRAAGFDHIAGAIGGAIAGWYGADMLCYITPAEHLGLPDVNHVKEGVIAFKIAAHIADIARGNINALKENREMSEARYRLNWEKQFELALFPKEAREIFEKRKSNTQACSMCGPFCPMNLVEKILKRV